MLTEMERKAFLKTATKDGRLLILAIADDGKYISRFGPL